MPSSTVVLGGEGQKPFTSAQAAEKRVLRYVLQASARRLLGKGCGVYRCLRMIRGKRGIPVEVYYSPEHGSAHYGNLVVCGSHWVCPVCAAKIAMRRLLEVQEVIEIVQARGGTVLFATNTVRHHVGQSLPVLLGDFLAAIRLWKSHRRYRELLVRLGYLGEIRSLEVTHGANGWHPHTHSLMFFDSGYVSAEGLHEVLRDEWAAVVARRGLGTIDRKHGFDLRYASTGEGASDLAGYLVKTGEAQDAGVWGPADELVRGNSKQGRGGGNRTPFALLADAAVHLDETVQRESGELFQTYAAAFKGKNHLRWSKGLRENLLVPLKRPDKPLSDLELAELMSDDADLLGTISVDLWRVILCSGPGVRGELLEVARSGDWGLVVSFIEGLR